ncbi:flagellar hook-length control protein FliK [Sphingomonas sp. RIT328]|uniref:flagellar hook-length control protein FliK n=1 Tax=Sphingomonas sp. RIT328 TaxID=1470591 RepID=UPI000446E230|nr:flagellar hook-length control protein FliK [Sphingomonas sp. RIT328]EZP48667.1 putative Flagellar hook-length control protein FliK [Sphingomonas sp. RIT328]
MTVNAIIQSDPSTTYLPSTGAPTDATFTTLLGAIDPTMTGTPAETAPLPVADMPDAHPSDTAIAANPCSHALDQTLLMQAATAPSPAQPLDTGDLTDTGLVTQSQTADGGPSDRAIPLAAPMAADSPQAAEPVATADGTPMPTVRARPQQAAAPVITHPVAVDTLRLRAADPAVTAGSPAVATEGSIHAVTPNDTTTATMGHDDLSVETAPSPGDHASTNAVPAETAAPQAAPSTGKTPTAAAGQTVAARHLNAPIALSIADGDPQDAGDPPSEAAPITVRAERDTDVSDAPAPSRDAEPSPAPATIWASAMTPALVQPNFTNASAATDPAVAAAVPTRAGNASIALKTTASAADAAADRDDSSATKPPASAAAAPNLVEAAMLAPRQADAPPRSVQAAQAAPSADATVTARPGRMGRELGVQIAHHVAAGRSAVTIRLEPDTMGRIDVRLSFDDSGRLNATVHAANPASLDLLRREAGDLGRALSDAGIRTDVAGFSFGSGQSGAGGQSGQSQPRLPQAQAYYAGGPVQDEAPAFRALRTSDRVDIIA